MKHRALILTLTLMAGVLSLGTSAAAAEEDAAGHELSGGRVSCDAGTTARLDRLSSAAEAKVAGDEGPLDLRVEITGDVAAFGTFRRGATSQLIGEATVNGDSTTIEMRHFDPCTGDFLPVESAAGGFAVFAEDGSWMIGAPWAYSSNGVELETSFSVSKDGALIQQIDTTRVTGIVTFDPTYTWISCANGYYSNMSAAQYLDMYSASTDYGYCAVRRIFFNTNGYLPVYGFETNVANDYGRIVLRQDGGCSFSPDTGWAWDFQVPCKAHDYCYDLRKAGFSGTVSDLSCDNTFYWIMEAHCNNRVFSGDCRLIRDTYYSAVRLGNVITHPNPEPVRLRNLNSSKCIDVPYASTSAGVRWEQYSCNGASHQMFTFHPIGGGDFWIRPEHASWRCARAVLGYVEQNGCIYNDLGVFRLQGSYNQDNYTLRPRNSSNCIDVPGSSTSNGVDLISYYCFETTNQRWRMT